MSCTEPRARGLRRRAAGVLVLAAGAAGVAAAPAPAADLPADPSNLSSVLGRAAAGDRVLLASGTYPTFRGASKPGTVTVTAAPGARVVLPLAFDGASNITVADVTVPSASLTGATRDIVVRDSTFTGAVRIDGLANADVLFAGNTHNDIDAPGQYSSPARIHLSYSSSTHSGVTIRDSVLRGGDADGVQSGVGVDIVGNEFRDILQDGPNHTDAIQLIGAAGSVVRGNLIRNSSSGIVAYDGLRRAVIEDNVLDLPTRPWGIELYSDSGSVVRHNTLKHGACVYNLPCGIIDISRKSHDPAGTGTVVVDNIASEISVSNGSSVAARHHNLVRRSPGPGDVVGTPVFAGGGSPTTYAGFALAAGSPGAGMASDGTNVGARVAARPAPVPVPTPPPVPVDVPALAVWTAPTGVQVGETVTLDGSRSTGNGVLSCTWSFENEDASIIWEQLTGCTLRKAFRYADTKYVKLIVRDADGDVHSSRRAFAVAP